MASKGWTCQRSAKGKVCKHHNGARLRKCGKCGKTRPPRKRPAHMAALDIPYERYIEINGGEHCGICGCGPTSNRKLDRDHSHVNGQPRGLLCRKHNRMLKRWLTDEFMRAALIYLEKTETLEQLV